MLRSLVRADSQLPDMDPAFCSCAPAAPSPIALRHALNSIPLALDEAVKSGKVQPGDVIACAGFGAGLSWGAAVIRWDYEFAG